MPRRPIQRLPHEELWTCSGTDAKGKFVTGILVVDGYVESVPAEFQWMRHRKIKVLARYVNRAGWTMRETNLAEMLQQGLAEIDLLPVTKGGTSPAGSPESTATPTSSTPSPAKW